MIPSPPSLLPLPFFPPSLVQGSTCWPPRALWLGGVEGWTGAVSDLGPFSSSLETGIILPSELPPHWWVSRLGFSFRLGPWHHRYSFPGMAGLFPGSFGCSLNCPSGRQGVEPCRRNHDLWLAWQVGALARREKGPNTSIFVLQPTTCYLKESKFVYIVQYSTSLSCDQAMNMKMSVNIILP